MEFKYIKRGKRGNPPSKTKINSLVKEAKEQLDDYKNDELVTNYLKDRLKLQMVVIVFWGWEMVYCEEYK